VTIVDEHSLARFDASKNVWNAYVRAERFLPWHAGRLVFGLDVDPHWIGKSDSFWYRAARRDGVEFVLVDPEKGTRRPAFDHARIASSLSTVSGIPVDPASLPFLEVSFDESHSSVRFSIEQQQWQCDLTSYRCFPAPDDAPSPASDVVRSPDGRWDAFIRNDNLWLRSVETRKERALTHDGEPQYGYGMPLPSPLASAGLAEADRPAVIWSPDGSRLLTSRIDARRVLFFHLVQSLPKDGSIRPQLHSYAYPLPGDEMTPETDFWAFDVASGIGVKADLAPLPMLYYGSPLNPNLVWWSNESDRAFILIRDRGCLSYRLAAIDPTTGDLRIVVTETSKRGIDPFLYWAAVGIRIVSDGEQVVWYSQRDGWAHLYLYDGKTGELVHQITQGAYNVSEVLHVDETSRMIYFTAVGREAGRDPYYTHLYRVSLDGGEPELLTPEDAEHSIVFSPSGQFFIDTLSRLDLSPISVLRHVSGERILELEHADIEALAATGWSSPERFTAKARDGVTDIYGVIFRPSNFDPSSAFPVIDSIYAGPQRNQAPTAFAGAARAEGGKNGVGGRWFWHAQALAELGFVVVMIDGLGMPGRSKAFHDVTYRNLGDGGIEDHIVALRQLADRYPYLDLNRVGIYGHSAGGYASAHAILAFPEFYKVCVSTAGNHDHRLDKASWVERYMGLPVEDHYRQQANQTLAAKLQGKLLLMHGEMDENVHPASTLVLVDALIKENKDFDLLIIPNTPHASDGDPYFVRRRWDYFVRHLLGEEPPSGYRISV